MFSWIEIYSGMEYKRFLQIKELMENNQIQTKSKVKSTRDRMSRNVLFGGNASVLNSSGMSSSNQEYIIMVKKENVEKARFLLSKQ